MPASAREIAVGRLLRVEDEGAFVARVGGGADPNRARDASDFVAGVTRWRRWLDFLLDRFYRGDIEALDPPLRQLLRIGLYDLVVRETPSHAAVNEAVETTRSMLHKGAAGLANAVLRAAVRAQQAGGLPEPETGDDAEDLAIRHSHPTWMVRRWLARWERSDVVRLLRANNAPPTFGLRVNTLVTTPEAVAAALQAMKVEATPSRWLDDFLTTQRLQPILRSDLLTSGHLAIQDEAAGLVVRVVDPQPGERVLDAAAAPGGKAVYLAIRMENRGEVRALDVSEAKTRLVAQSAEAHGVRIVQTERADLRTWPTAARYDRVLLDAPCSGTGVLAKRADLRWNRSPDDLAELTALQDALLDAAAAHVRPGGALVYATCSIEPEENTERVAAFLGRHPEFTRDALGDRIPEPLCTVEGDYQALPHLHGTDGAYAARLVKSA